MLNWFKKRFAGASKPRSGARKVRPMLESLEEREVPSGGQWSGMHHDPGAFDRAQFGSAFAGATNGWNGNEGWGEGRHGSPTLVASLTGSSGTSSSAAYSSNTSTGQNSLRVHVSGLTANTTYTVSSGSTTLGNIKTNANGQGTLAVSDVSTTLTAGSPVTVADSSGNTVLSGTLAASRLVATLGGSSGGDGIAFYHASPVSGQNSLRVGLFGLTANATYTVQLNGNTIGTVTTNANGRGQLSQTNLATPPTAGSIVTVLDSTGATILQGTLAAGESSFFGFFGGFGFLGSRHHD
jgi:hypothetical protein